MAVEEFLNCLELKLTWGESCQLVKELVKVHNQQLENLLIGLDQNNTVRASGDRIFEKSINKFQLW